MATRYWVGGLTATKHVAIVNCNSIPSGIIVTASIPASNTLRITLANYTASPIDPGNATYSWFAFGTP